MLIPLLDNCICFTGYGVIEAMLEPFLIEEAGANQFQVGFTFVILGAVYMVMALLAGNVRCISSFKTLLS